MEENKTLQKENASAETSAESTAEAPVPAQEEKAIDTAISLKYADKKEVAKGGLLGAFIGLAIIVPGVSGSVAAIILRLYEKLLYALGNILKEFKKCAKFLLPVAVGAVVGVVAGFFGIKALLNLIPFAIVALFAGLMFGSFPAIRDQLCGEKITPARAVLFAVGLLIPIGISCAAVFTSIGSVDLGNLKFYHYIILLVLGFVVAITQLVPGLSATALLMSVGYFTPLINSVSISYWKENPAVFGAYACLAVGFLVGLIAVSKGLSKLLEKFHAPAFYTIAGLSLGSSITMFFNPEICETYSSWAGGAPWVEIVCGVALFIIGIILAYFFVRYERKHTSKQ